MTVIYNNNNLVIIFQYYTDKPHKKEARTTTTRNNIIYNDSMFSVQWRKQQVGNVLTRICFFLRRQRTTRIPLKRYKHKRAGFVRFFPFYFFQFVIIDPNRTSRDDCEWAEPQVLRFFPPSGNDFVVLDPLTF